MGERDRKEERERVMGESERVYRRQKGVKCEVKAES